MDIEKVFNKSMIYWEVQIYLEYISNAAILHLSRDAPAVASLKFQEILGFLISHHPVDYVSYPQI